MENKVVYKVLVVLLSILSVTTILASGLIVSCSNTEGQSIEVELTWTAPGDDGVIGQADHYAIGWATDSTNLVNDFTTYTMVEVATSGPAGTQESFIVSGLESSTTYWFAIETADEVPNWSLISNVPSITTKDLVPPADIDDLTVEEVK